MAFGNLIFYSIFPFVVQALEEPEKRLIDNGFLFDHAWEYQNLLSNLQDDINLAIHEVQVAVSTVLGSSTKQTLEQYESHFADIEREYVPMLAAFDDLKPTPCKTQAETILNSTTTLTGFDASNCASSYNGRVKEEIAAANRQMARFDELYNQVQSVVVQAFMGRNSFLTPEAIEDKITEIYELIDGRWTAAKPEMEAVRRNLAAAIKDQNIELDSCHTVILNRAILLFGIYESNILTCERFDNTPSSMAMSNRAVADSEPYRYILDEFEAEVAKMKPYVWKA